MPESIIAGNWKMHGDGASARALCRASARVAAEIDATVVLFVPSLLVAVCRDELEGTAVGLGVQNVHAEREGAFTGEISAEMARDAGVAWSLVGHSERRALFGETDADVGAKTSACLRAGLRPVVCVGEDLDARHAGRAQAVVSGQLEGLRAVVGVDALARIVVAYEPVWAIGTGETATPEVAETMHAHVRGWFAGHGAMDVSILYGGSVNENNAAALLAMPNIDGALVGGASLDAERFGAICRAAG